MIEEKDVEHIANLARLELTDDEKKKFTNQLGRILEHAKKISELDTENIEPTSHAVILKNVFRDDKVDNEIKREKALQNAPDSTDDAFKVPRIL